MTQEEINARDDLINSQFSHLPGFASDIETNSKANGGKLGPLLDRGELWINRYNEAFNASKVMACRDEKLKWNINPTKDNCPSCLKLNGKVKRASYWDEKGIETQAAPNPNLECEGWRCGCSLDPTDDSLSKGPLPNLP